MSKIMGYVTSWLDAIPETEQEWIGKLEELKATERRAGWEFAKWLQWGCRQYNRTVEDIAFQVGYSPHTLTNILSAMNNTAAPLAQELELSLSHAVAVLGLAEDEKAALLTEAAENSWGADKLRFVARGQRMTNLLSLGGNATGSAPFNDSSTHAETYQYEQEDATAPGLCNRDGCYERASVEDRDGIAICADHYVTEAQGDDVPFSHVPLAIDIAPPVKPFEVAEYIVAKWGAKFAADVAGEVGRWW